MVVRNPWWRGGRACCGGVVVCPSKAQADLRAPAWAKDDDFVEACTFGQTDTTPWLNMVQEMMSDGDGATKLLKKLGSQTRKM